MARPDLVLIPCGAAKLDRPAPAGELYTGSYHRDARRAADALSPDRVLIVSALHGLLQLGQLVAPYDKRTGDPGSVTAATVRGQADALGVLGARRVVALAGRAYAELVRAVWPDLLWPLAGARGMGSQLAIFAEIRRAGRLPARILEQPAGTVQLRTPASYLAT
jgi:hypothetical protein